MAIIINDPVSYKGGNFTGIYGRVVPTLSESGEKVSGDINWYFSESAFELNVENKLDMKGRFTLGQDSNLPVDFIYGYDAAENGNDILLFATNNIIAYLSQYTNVTNTLIVT
ncbi:MAG: hypothetical protein HN704_14600 [Bacteroidetes bacterium]|jgi:hypothetical protein|nr:hypothetical protein [Bacteroidota bacterium]MBT7492827.1 hypothetical protein [Bacteroidota bacterium]